MSSVLILSYGVEWILIVLTVFCLLGVVRETSQSRQSKWKLVWTWGGFVLLSLTFCWSVILGAVLVLHQVIHF